MSLKMSLVTVLPCTLESSVIKDVTIDSVALYSGAKCY